MPNPHTAAVDLSSLLDGSSAGELIPEMVRNGLQQLIQLELAAFLGADWHERTEERLGLRNGYRTRTLTTQGCLKVFSGLVMHWRNASKRQHPLDVVSQLAEPLAD